MEVSWPAMLLHRINSEKNEARFYLVEAGSSLIDPYAVIRLWGRIGGHQRGLVTPCASAEEAERLAWKLARQKIKRGYIEIKEEAMNALTRSILQKRLVPAIEVALDGAVEEDGVVLPVLGQSSSEHMALAVINILEALEDAQEYIAAELPDNIKEEMGI